MLSTVNCNHFEFKSEVIPMEFEVIPMELCKFNWNYGKSRYILDTSPHS